MLFILVVLVTFSATAVINVVWILATLITQLLI